MFYSNFYNREDDNASAITQFLHECPNSFEFSPIKPEFFGNFNSIYAPEMIPRSMEPIPEQIELEREMNFQEEQPTMESAEFKLEARRESITASGLIPISTSESTSPASSPVSSRCQTPTPAEDFEPCDNSNFGSISISNSNSNSTPRRGAIRRTRSHEDGLFINVAAYLHLPQHEAAKSLGIPSSTLSKRWKEATNNRKWPFRVLAKLDKEIVTLAQNACHSNSEKLNFALVKLSEKRKEVVKDIHIRL